MNSSLEGAASNSLERRKMSLNKKRQLVYELSKNPDEALKVLKSWTCLELRHVLCSEPEKQKDYTGLSKKQIINLILKTVSEREGKFNGLSKEEIINLLLKAVSEKNNGDGEVKEKNSSPSTSNSKKQMTPTAKTKGNLSPLPRSLEAESNTSSEEKQEAAPAPEDLPIAPLRLDQICDHQDRPENVTNIEKSTNYSFGLEDWVKITRQLEFSGLIVREFRDKLLCWYAFKATAHEKNVVKAFVNAFKDDPKDLIDQLIDTFSESVLREDSASDGGSSRGCVSCKKLQR